MAFRLFFFIFVWCAATNGVQANEACPKRVGYIEKNGLTRLVLPIMQKIYQQLECQTEFVNLPGRRGIIAFNEGRVEAELIRFRLVEDQYMTPFVRSKVPLLQLRSYFWKNPVLQDDRKLPFGYVKGSIWQEEYAKGKPFNAFYNTQSMFKAYNAGQIAGFLATGPAVDNARQKNLVSPAPLAVELVKEAPLYHYTASPYQHFMDRFDRYLETHRPFSHMSVETQRIININ